MFTLFSPLRPTAFGLTAETAGVRRNSPRAWDNGSQHPAARTAASPAVTRLLHPAVTLSHFFSFSTNRCSSLSDAMRRCRFQKGLGGGANPSPASMCRNHQSRLLHRFLVDVALGGKGPVEEALSDLLFLGTRATPRQRQSLHTRKPFAKSFLLSRPLAGSSFPDGRHLACCTKAQRIQGDVCQMWEGTAVLGSWRASQGQLQALGFPKRPRQDSHRSFCRTENISQEVDQTAA